MLLHQKHGVCRTEIHECSAHPRDFLENPQSCFEGSFLNPLTFLRHERWKNAARRTGTAAWKSVCGRTPPISREAAAAAGASAAAGRPGPQRRRIPTLTATRFPLSLLRLLSSPVYVRPEWLLCNTDESVEVYGGVGGVWGWGRTYLDSSWRPSSRR